MRVREEGINGMGGKGKRETGRGGVEWDRRGRIEKSRRGENGEGSEREDEDMYIYT